MSQTAPTPALPAAYESGHRISALDLALVVGIHVGGVAALLAADVLPLPAALASLTVRVIPPAAPALPVAIPPPRRPAMASQPLAPRRPDPVPPVLAAETPVASAGDVAVLRDVPPSTAAPAPVQAPPPTAPAVSEPRFDAAYLDNPAPVYPAISRRIGEEGKLVLRVFVEADGRPSQVQVRTGSGSPRLDQAAVDAVRRWKFVAARKGADEVGAWVLVPIVFTLKG